MSSERPTKILPSSRIGVRLTAWGTLVTMAVCAALCAMLYVGLGFSLRREVDGFLLGEVREFMAILQEEKGKSLDEIEREVRHEIGSRLRRDLSFRVLDEQGRLVVSSDLEDPLRDSPVDKPPSRAHGSKPWFETIEYPEPKAAIRICNLWTQLPGGGAHLVQATYGLDTVTSSLYVFRKLCIAGMILATVLSIIGGSLLARKSLRPIHHMTETARRIGSENLSSRLKRTDNGDELDRLAAVLNDMLARIERQFQHVQQFTADAAHELRTPLAALRGNVEVALSSAASAEDLRKVMEESIEEYDRLSRIAEDLLLLARADSGRPFLQCVVCSMSAAVSDAVDLFMPLAQEKNVEIEFADRQAIHLFADGARIRQLLCNLLDNAIKYTPEWGKVTVTARYVGDLVELVVRDTGQGIPEEHLTRLFDRFYRADTGRSRKAGGSGLGLAIARTIVVAHGGTIEARKAAPGTMFVVRLPVRLTKTTLTPQTN